MKRRVRVLVVVRAGVPDKVYKARSQQRTRKAHRVSLRCIRPAASSSAYCAATTMLSQGMPAITSTRAPQPIMKFFNAIPPHITHACLLPVVPDRKVRP